VKEIILALLVLSLLFAVIAMKRLEDERDEWKDRLYITLKSTSDAARSSEKRLRQAVELLKEEEAKTLSLPLDIPIKTQKQELTPKIAKEEFYEVTGKTTVMLFCYNRADYLQRTLQSLVSRLDSAVAFRENGFRIVISQDGYDGRVREVSETFVAETKTRGITAEHIQHMRIEARDKGHMAAYYALSTHYSKGLDYAFKDGSNRVIILEDDLELAVDFFPYFQAFSRSLEEDDSLLAISAWNDHGQASHVSDSRRLYRTDIFPGLGWMLSRRVWDELKPKWPLAFWDDWLREPAQRKGRHVIHPEVSRTVTFGESGGASQGQFFATYLKTMKLNDVDVRFSKTEIDAMKKKPFDDWFMNKVNQAKLVGSPNEVLSYSNGDDEFRIVYTSIRHFMDMAPSLGIMDDVKEGMPRSAYRGILPVRYQGKQLYIVPQNIPPLG
jgi:alpha-1,3-mannosyl-glycoprotein beta-1,2-N-acetylglucosaminyltransferase